MKTFHEAREIILDNIYPIESELIFLGEALHRVIATDIHAPFPIPPWDNSAMDGFAVSSDACAAGSPLAITGVVHAGSVAAEPLTLGSALRIMTGAPMPEGADAVIPWEEADEAGGAVTPKKAVSMGQHVRYRGEDLQEGSLVVAQGTLLRPPQIGLLASCGSTMIPVYRKPRIAIVSTGDELVNLGEPIGPGQIINSNSLSLAAAVREAGGEPVMLGIARDSLEMTREKLSAALSCDALVTSAGVSAGDKDLVRTVLESLGARQLFWKILIKPGHPTAFSMYGTKPLFSLPGNPVSSLITFEMLVKPALLKMRGHRHPVPPLLPALLREEVRKKPGRLHFLRVQLMKMDDGTVFATSAGDQNTGIAKTLNAADGLAILPADETLFPAGSSVNVQILNHDFANSCY